MLNDFDLMVLPDSIIYAHFHTFARWHMHTNGKSCVTQKYLKEKNDLSWASMDDYYIDFW